MRRATLCHAWPLLCAALLNAGACNGSSLEPYRVGTAASDAAMFASDGAWPGTLGAADAGGRGAGQSSATSADARTENGPLVLPESCFGRCGPSPADPPADGRCGCDRACVTRGDCCFDKHTLCAVEGARGVCTLTGVGPSAGLCGTDLGFSYSHENKLEIIFGDSYDGHCETLPLMPNDDSQGVLPLTLPDLLTHADDTAPVDCTGLLALDRGTGEKTDSFAQVKLYDGTTSLSLAYGETALSAFSDGERAHVIFRRGASIESPLYVSYRDAGAAVGGDSPRATYHVATTFNDLHFKNITVSTVAHFDPTDLTQSDFADGHGALFMWGRPAFNGPTARPVYLLTASLPLHDDAGNFAWNPRYFSGFVVGIPQFSVDAGAAVPVLTEDFSRVMQLEVAYVAALRAWVMLYGGDVADFLDSSPPDQPRRGAIYSRFADAPWGPFTDAAPALFREQLGPYLHCDAPAQATAGAESGCDADDSPDDPEHSYNVGTWAPEQRDFPGCLTSYTAPQQPNLIPGSALPLPCPGAQRGNLYAPNLLTQWTMPLAFTPGYSRAAALFLNVSTWAPYQVILARLEVRLP